MLWLFSPKRFQAQISQVSLKSVKFSSYSYLLFTKQITHRLTIQLTYTFIPHVFDKICFLMA